MVSVPPAARRLHGKTHHIEVHCHRLFSHLDANKGICDQWHPCLHLIGTHTHKNTRISSKVPPSDRHLMGLSHLLKIRLSLLSLFGMISGCIERSGSSSDAAPRRVCPVSVPLPADRSLPNDRHLPIDRRLEGMMRSFMTRVHSLF